VIVGKAIKVPPYSLSLFFSPSGPGSSASSLPPSSVSLRLSRAFDVYVCIRIFLSLFLSLFPLADLRVTKGP